MPESTPSLLHLIDHADYATTELRTENKVALRELTVPPEDVGAAMECSLTVWPMEYS